MTTYAAIQARESLDYTILGRAHQIACEKAQDQGQLGSCYLPMSKLVQIADARHYAITRVKDMCHGDIAPATLRDELASMELELSARGQAFNGGVHMIYDWDAWQLDTIVKTYQAFLMYVK